MRPAFALVLLLVSATSSAEIYRWVDSEGRVQFSDRPQPGADTVASPPDAASSQSEDAAGAAKDDGAAILGPYTSFEIAAPEPNQTLRQEQGTVGVGLLLDPSLIEGQRLQLRLDGAALPVNPTLGTQLTLNDVAFGTHTAQAEILGANGQLVARTPAVTFHLRRPLPVGVIP